MQLKDGKYHLLLKFKTHEELEKVVILLKTIKFKVFELKKTGEFSA